MNKQWGTQVLRATAVGSGAAVLAALGVASPVLATDLEAKFNFSIAPQDLTTALVELSRQADAQVVSDTQYVGAAKSAGVNGEMALKDALRTLLAGTTLAYKATDAGVIAVGAFAQSASTAAGSMQSAEPAAAETMVEEIVVTSTKIDMPIVEVPQSMSMISREQLETRGVQGMTEALRYVPGTIVDNYGHEPRGYEYVIMRGFDALFTGNYRDGLNQATGLYFASFVTEPYNVERIEVIRGPASALFGQADAGGIVNRISKRPRADLRSEIEVQVGNNDRKQVAVDVGGALDESGSLLYRFVGVGLDTETQQRYPNGARPSIETSFFAPSLTWHISEDTSLTFLTDLRKGDIHGTTSYATWADGTFSGVPVGDPKHVRYQQDQTSLGYQLDHQFNDTWGLRQNFRFARADVEVEEIFRNFFLASSLDADGRTQHRIAAATQERLDQTLLDTQLHATLQAGAFDHNLLLGVDASQMDADLDFFLGEAPSLDLVSPVYGQPIAKATELLFGSRQENQQVGVYAQDKIERNRWIFTFGARYDWVEGDTFDQDGVLEAEIREQAFTGRAGLIYRYDNGLAPYLSYTQSFLPQSGRDFEGDPFKPSRGTQYEIGLKYQTPTGRALYTVALFEIVKDNILTPDFENDFFYRTSGERRSRGVELEANARLGGGFNLAAQYSYLDAEVTKSNSGDVGKRPFQLPEHTASVWLDYAFQGALSGLGLSAGVRYVGERFDDAMNEFESPSYTLFDAAVHYDRGPWRFALNSANLTDKKYFATGSVGNGYYPGVRRTLIASAKYRW